MMFVIIIMSCLISICIVEDFLHIPPKVYSKYLIVDIIIQLLRCPMCFSYWLTAISWLIWFGTGWGFYFGFITYWLTYFVKKYFTDLSI